MLNLEATAGQADIETKKILFIMEPRALVTLCIF